MITFRFSSFIYLVHVDIAFDKKHSYATAVDDVLACRCFMSYIPVISLLDGLREDDVRLNQWVLVGVLAIGGRSVFRLHTFVDPHPFLF